MNPLCERYADEWDLLALDGLEAERALELRAHLATGCAVCRQSYGECLAASRALALSVPKAQPSDDAERLLRGRLERSAVPRPVRIQWPWAAAAASLLLAGWLAWDRAQMAARLVQVPVPQPAATVESARPVAEKPPPAPSHSSEVMALRAELSRAQSSLRLAEEAGRDAREELQREQARQEAARTEATERAQRAEQSLREAEARLAAAVSAPAAPAPKREESQPVAAAQLALVQAELAAARRALDTQANQLAEYRRVFRALEGSALRQVEMQSVDPGGGRATARAVFSSEGLILFARDLPKLPPDKCYQLWIVRRGGPAIVSGGLLQTDAQGRGVLVAGSGENLKEATGFAITDEPQGGSASARGKKLLFGAL